MSVNKVILLGNVGKDPAIRYVEQRPVAEFSLATTDRAYTTSAGVQIPSVLNGTVWCCGMPMLPRLRNIYVKAPNYMWKGSCVHVRGRTAIQ